MRKKRCVYNYSLLYQQLSHSHISTAVPSLLRERPAAACRATMQAAASPLLASQLHVHPQCCPAHAPRSSVHNGCIALYRQQSRRLTRSRTDRCARIVTQMGLKIVENFNAAFELQPQAEDELHKLLSSEAFCQQVVKECQLGEGSKVKFSGQLFQPVPWSVTTRKGMPTEFEKYSGNPKFTIINIPPNFMFQAKVFKPSRLCAVYECL